ncbi:MAG: 50S ribosomal protein L15, partial [Halobacteriota archaeon]|nr:50S ribosomal protein L15 [Halobacteriota archaeon]
MDKKKVKKFRGTRTCGGGTHKNRRGAGNRG